MESYKVLDIPFEAQGVQKHLYPVLLLSGSDAVLVDCGYPGFLDRIEAALQLHGLSGKDLTKLLLTHQDDDHMGAAKELVSKYPQIQVAASAVETPYISGERKNLRLQQAEELQSLLPEEQQEFGRQFCEKLRQVPPVAVDIRLHDGDRFDWGGGCQIIATPGHTPGHISLFFPEERAVITGDAAIIADGELSLANPQFCLDTAGASRSLEKLRALGGKRYICYHSGVLQTE